MHIGESGGKTELEAIGFIQIILYVDSSIKTKDLCMVFPDSMNEKRNRVVKCMVFSVSSGHPFWLWLL